MVAHAPLMFPIGAIRIAESHTAADATATCCHALDRKVNASSLTQGEYQNDEKERLRH